MIISGMISISRKPLEINDDRFRLNCILLKMFGPFLCSSDVIYADSKYIYLRI